MTRRIRFTPFVFAGAFAAALASPHRASAVQLPFVAQPAVPAGAHVLDLAQADIDRDGDVDLVSASRFASPSGDGAVHWYENDGGAWTQRLIFTAPGSAWSVATGDVDGDGDVDVVVTGLDPNRLQWYENVAGNGTAWAPHTVGSALIGFDAQPDDVDGDGDTDLVVAGRDLVVWFEQTGQDPWTLHTIFTPPGDMTAVAPADVDGDGDSDVVFAGRNLPATVTVAWAENTSGAGTAWAIHTLFSGPSLGAPTLDVVDLDGDGDLDAVAGYFVDTFSWFENNGTAAWPRHTVTGPGLPYTTAVSTADLDSDGDQDVLAVMGPRASWFENAAGNASSWTYRIVGDLTGDFSLTVLATDVDEDGDQDYVLGTQMLDRVQWYRNDSIHRSACFAPAAAISTASPGAYAVATADVDGDGALDVVATANEYNAVLWHENAAGNGSSWLPHTITTAPRIPLSASAADVDGDGDTDVLATSFLDDHVAWYENVNGAGTFWTAFPISTAIDAPGSVRAADVDGDGDTDAVAAASYGGILWFANTAGNGTVWTAGTIAGGSAAAATVADLDRDGDLDVAGTTGYSNPVVRWHDNTAGNGSAWTPRTIANLAPALSFDVTTADVDHDGDPDVIASFDLPKPMSGLRWFGNLDGAGGAWSTQTISTDRTFKVAAGDLDGDGDIDVLSTAYESAALRWHEQDGGAWTPRTIATAFTECRGVTAGDLDRDGDVDVVATYPDAGRIDWFANRGGQFSLATDDIAPPSGENGTEVAMLRAIVTHQGRAGDGSLELAALGLLFEEAAGDPLTSAEANALVENLRVYRDANGSGVFDPGTDVLVAEVPTLSLAAGIQTVPFTDGDANVEIVFGAPRTYFVVVHLTGNASTQSPNTFRVTLLGQGSSASRAEDRTYDIPLVPACPRDVSSAFMSTPVTLTGFTVE
jgi:hypothetical protein